MNNVISMKTTPDPEGADIWLAMIGMLSPEPEGDEEDEEWAGDDVDWDLLGHY